MYEFLDRRYAKALFDIAKESGKEEEYLHQLYDVCREIDQCEDMRVVLDHPNISIKEKKELFTKIWGDRVDKYILSFLKVLIHKRRIKFLREKIVQYEEIMLKSKGIVEVRVKSTILLKDDQKEKMRKIFLKKVSKDILIRNEIDKELIGGYTLRYDDKFIDYSIKGKIDSIGKK